ncbi:MarR family transcriptional regulator [Paenibacillus cisolokensis]|mgnify:CR=1 FL=1|jgi:Transcriptional regulators|uniref:HTH marR-type domain-containing protein n=1 Tax=Paenibacillus cisolokensis TaxID=1658519 RepID=A0ABQ4NAK1_9BACL|nr:MULTISPECIES: MarR family transcriptional regulator [Paenibacillus]ALS27066.1 MarR family transcriptional regulator [Paenibacillus sp. 32O-W]GIQ65264.1 hypothetical protein PACILC2_38320 [Paenibacillus cisolokensis]
MNDRRPNAEEADAIRVRLDEAFRRVRRLIQAEWNKHNELGLGFSQGRLLLLLAEGGPQKVTAIAETLNITNGAVTGVADRLIELGLVKRERGEADRRVVLLDITDAGRELVSFIYKKRIQLMNRLFRDMSIEEMTELIGFFERMVRNLESEEDDPSDET